MKKIVNGRVLNWKPSLPDKRDFKYSMVEHGSAVKAYPPKVDLRPLCSPVVDQGDLGSCTGNAGAGAIEFLELQEMRDNVPPGTQAPQEYVANKFSPVSRMFIYQNELILDGDFGQDNGANMRDICMVALKTGVPRESSWAYDMSLFTTKPNAAVYAEAAKHKVKAFYQLNNMTDMKRCLYHGFPFVFGISVYDSFMSDAAASSGIIPMPNVSTETLQGGHALCCVGYDDTKMSFIVRNSWGTSWGDQGYCYMPYAYLSDADLASDMYTLRRL